MYGLISHSRLSKKEAKVRVVDAEKKKIRDEQLAVERVQQQESKLTNIYIILNTLKYNIFF